MARKTLDKAKLVKAIELTREFWQTGDIRQLEERAKLLPPTYEDAWWVWMAIFDVLTAVIGILKLDATDEDIFKIFQSLGYDIV